MDYQSPAANLSEFPAQRHDPQRVASCAARYGLSLVPPSGVEKARAFAIAHIGAGIAEAQVFAEVQRITGAALFWLCDNDAVTGVFAGFPLRREGLDLCLTGRFNAQNFDPNLAASAHTLAAAWYGWGFAATAKRAAYAVVSAARAIQTELYWAVPAFARAVTPQGRRITGKIGYEPPIGAEPGWLWIPPRVASPLCGAGA